MRILLTGASGQLGHALRAELTMHEITAPTRQQLDISSANAVREAVETVHPELVINAAAFNDVDGAETRWREAFKVNGLGPRNLALASAAVGVPLLHVSTDYVFDGTSERPYHEFDLPNPLSVYAASKLAGENAVRTLHHLHYLVRTAWLYHAIGRNFARTMCGLANQRIVRVVNDQYGSPTYAPHLARAIARLVETEAYGTYHFAGRGGASWFEMTSDLYRHLGLKTSLQPVSRSEFPRPAERPRYSVLTTLQDPEILLPPWQEGVAQFAHAVRSGSTG